MRKRSKIQSKLARLRREGATFSGAGPAPDQSAQDQSAQERTAEMGTAEVGTGRDGPGSQRPSAPRAPLPSWLGQRLAIRDAQRATAGGERGRPAPDASVRTSAEVRAMSQWETTHGDPLRLVQVERLEGTFSAREERIELEAMGAPAAFRHGHWALDEIDAADTSVIARIARDPSLEGIDLRNAIFLDTETSGLSGGAGVYVYMVGLGSFEGDQYVSWQSFLRHPGEERAMLAEVAERIRGRGTVISFFGKSFDRHRLEDKMRIAGVEPPFEGRPHLDLYHPFRRLTQGQFINGKLQTMERELLGFHRERDLPGSLAPAAWFDYLAGRPHLLEGVFQHNHEDVLSLVGLTAYLGRAEEERRRCGASLVGPAARRAAALAETAESPGERLRWAEAALARGAAGADRRRMQLLRAEHHRRAGAVDAARTAYREALEECADDRLAVDLFVGASMLLEHTVGDLPHARRFAERALSLGEDKRLAKGQLFALRRRVERLTLKTGSLS